MEIYKDDAYNLEEGDLYCINRNMYLVIESEVDSEDDERFTISLLIAENRLVRNWYKNEKPAFKVYRKKSIHWKVDIIFDIIKHKGRYISKAQILDLFEPFFTNNGKKCIQKSR